MKEIKSDELKRIQLKILNEIDIFCKKNHYNYYLAGGTLIGAIRHKGYIPWDDDIDIFMKRNDYEKFVKEFKTENTNIISIENNSKYYLPFAKAISNKTILKEEVASKVEMGVYVDIFPLDKIPSEKIDSFYKKQKILINFLNLKNIKMKKRAFWKNIVVIIGKTVLLPFSKKSLIKMINKRAKKFSNTKCDKIGNLIWLMYGKKDIWDINAFDETTSVKFENIDAMIPKGYDHILKTTYGDYMKLPPVEQRQAHHSFQAWWK